MKIAEIKLPDNWEPWECEICPFSYLHDTEDGLENVCILQTESDGCPVKAEEVESMTREEINRIKYMVCCPMCDNEKCVRDTDKCEAEIWARDKEKEE